MSAGTTRVAFVGVGAMGFSMCGRLISAGFEVAATDVRPELRHQAASIGARWAPSVADAASDAELLITMLPGPGEVSAVISAVVGSLQEGSCWLEMSTASPRVARAIADAAGPRDVRVIDAPVGGGPQEAKDGRLVVFAGGDPAQLRAVGPVLDVLADRVVHTGLNGSGYAVKLLSNALWFMQAVGVAEVLAIADRMGLDLDAVLGALQQSAAGSRFLARDAEALLNGDDLTAFSLARCCEELSSVLELGDDLGAPLELVSVVAGVHVAALERYGDVDGELLGARFVGERAGVDLRRG